MRSRNNRTSAGTIRPFLALLVAAAFASPARAQDPAGGLYGHLERGVYVSPTGTFRIESPVQSELGGTITDTPNVATFQDDFTTLVSIGSFAQDATQRWEFATRGLRDYLIYFFSNFVLADFRRVFPGTHAEDSAVFSPGTMDGALFTYVLLPGGSMFAGKVPFFVSPDKLPPAKRGNVIFVRNGFTFVVSIELAERITEGSKYSKTPEEEDRILRTRLTAILSKIQFTKPPASP